MRFIPATLLLCALSLLSLPAAASARCMDSFIECVGRGEIASLPPIVAQQPRGRGRVSEPMGRVSAGWGGSLVDRARVHVGKTAADLGLPRTLWCADFMNMISGGGTGSRAAASWLHAGYRVSGPQVGAVALIVRGRRGVIGHVGIVSGVDAAGNPIIISGNFNRRVAEAVYPRGRVYAYVVPSS